MSGQLLINGEKAFERILKRIKEAKEEIFINMFIWRDDRIGNEVAKEILDAANRGVKVKIVKDKVGILYERTEENKQSFFHKGFAIRLLIKRFIVSLMYFRYLKKLTKKQFKNSLSEEIINHKNVNISYNDYRWDHSKFYIIDKEFLILGGINIEDKELYNDLKERKYADYMIEFNDKDTVGDFLEKYKNRANDVSVENTDFSFNIRKRHRFDIKPQIINLIENAKTSLDIEMAYWGEKDVAKKIIEASNRGIKVSIIIPEESNIQNSLNYRSIKNIMKNVKGEIDVFLSKRMVHSKFACVDNSVMFFGSANYNDQGLSKLSELNALVKNDDANIEKWRAWRTEHLQECIKVTDYNKLKYNKITAFFEGLVS